MVWPALGTYADMGAFEQGSDLIGQQHGMADSNLYSGEWRFHALAVSESYVRLS